MESISDAWMSVKDEFDDKWKNKYRALYVHDGELNEDGYTHLVHRCPGDWSVGATVTLFQFLWE